MGPIESRIRKLCADPLSRVDGRLDFIHLLWLLDVEREQIASLEAEVTRLHDKYDHQLLVKENAELKAQHARHLEDGSEFAIVCHWKEKVEKLQAENKTLRDDIAKFIYEECGIKGEQLKD